MPSLRPPRPYNPARGSGNRGGRPRRSHSRAHPGGGKRARDLAPSAAVDSGFDGASRFSEFELTRVGAKKRARAGGGEVGA